MQSTQNVRELTDRREIRANVTQALASLPMSSVLDIDQISLALAQSTVSNHHQLSSFQFSSSNHDNII